MADELDNEITENGDEPIVTPPSNDVPDDTDNTDDPSITPDDGENIPSEPEEETHTTIKYRMVDISEDDENKVVTISEIKEFQDNEQTASAFKTKPQDILNIYAIDDEAVSADESEIESAIAAIEERRNEYTDQLSSLQNSYTSAFENYESKQEEILNFEEANKTVPEDDPEGEPYFDVERLDSELQAEYQTLQTDAAALESEVTRIDTEIEELKKTNTFDDEIAAEQAKIENIHNITSSFDIGTEIPFKYFKKLNSQEYLSNPIPANTSYIELIIVDDDVPDFTDTESENSPYYYIIGSFANREVSGNTTKCLVFESVNQYDDLKTLSELQTHFNFDKVYAISKTYKDIINSKRDSLSNNAITESGLLSLLDTYETFIPESDISELTIDDENSLVPSLVVLLKKENEEGGGEGEGDETEQPNPEEPEDKEYDQYLRAGKISIFNNVIFIVPDNSEGVKKIVFVNGYYYILMKNCYIYKLNENYELVTTIDLTKISTDINKTDIFTIGNMLIIQSDRTYVTDSESIKNNYGIVDTTVTIDSVKLNTKTIVKINMK